LPFVSSLVALKTLTFPLSNFSFLAPNLFLFFCAALRLPFYGEEFALLYARAQSGLFSRCFLLPMHRQFLFSFAGDERRAALEGHFPTSGEFLEFSCDSINWILPLIADPA